MNPLTPARLSGLTAQMVTTQIQGEEAVSNEQELFAWLKSRPLAVEVLHRAVVGWNNGDLTIRLAADCRIKARPEATPSGSIGERQAELAAQVVADLAREGKTSHDIKNAVTAMLEGFSTISQSPSSSSR